MSMMENIIRPFSPVNIYPALQAPRETPEVPGVVLCQLGGSGGTTTSISFNGEMQTIESEGSFKESGRESTKVQVSNPDDPDQFVEFCRADKINLTPTNKGAKKPPRTSSYDTTGGYHDMTGNMNHNAVGSGNRDYAFQYPKDTTCVSPAKPQKGC